MQWSLARASEFLFPSVLDGVEKGELTTTPTHKTTNLQIHRAAGMEDKRYTIHSFRTRRAASHNMDGTAMDVLMKYVRRKSANLPRRHVAVTASAAAAGMKRSLENDVHRGGRLTAVRAVCAFKYSVPTGQLKPVPQGAEVKPGYDKHNQKDAGNITTMAATAMRKGRGTSMGVTSCRSREASVMPTYIRVKATSKCFCGNVGTKSRGGRRASPECSKSLFRLRWKRKTRNVYSPWRPTAARQSV